MTAASGTETPSASDRILTIPNALSVLRLLGVPLFLWLLLGPHADGWALGVLALSGVTDWADGVLARRLNQRSDFGALLDPAADRLYILATLFGLVLRHIIALWLALVIIARDLILGIALIPLRRRGYAPPEVHYLGKAATFCLLYAFPLLLLGAHSGHAVRHRASRSPGRSRSGGPACTCGPGRCICARSSRSCGRPRQHADARHPDAPAVQHAATRRPRPGSARPRLRRGCAAQGEFGASRRARAWYEQPMVALGCLIIGFILAAAWVHTHRGAPEAAKVHDSLVQRVRSAEDTTQGPGRPGGQAQQRALPAAERRAPRLVHPRPRPQPQPADRRRGRRDRAGPRGSPVRTGDRLPNPPTFPGTANGRRPAADISSSTVMCAVSSTSSGPTVPRRSR